MGYKKTMYPMYPKLGYNLGYKLGCMGEISQQSFLVETTKKNLCLKNWNFLGKNLKNRGLGAKNQKSTLTLFLMGCVTPIISWGGLGTKNQKLTSNISKLVYFEAFCQKIQKLKIFVKKTKMTLFRVPKLKNSPFTFFSPFFRPNLSFFPPKKGFPLIRGSKS